MTSSDRSSPADRPRVVLVTGGSAGIGRATVARLAADGARVVTCARDGDRLAEAVEELPGVTGLAADTADGADRARLVEAVLERHGLLDAVVLNAGLGWAGPVEDMPTEAVEALSAAQLYRTACGVLAAQLDALAQVSDQSVEEVTFG